MSEQTTEQAGGQAGGLRTRFSTRFSRRTVVTAVTVIVALVLAGSVWWWHEAHEGLHLRAEFTSAVGIYPGNDVRILDVPVGKVDSVTPHGTDVTISMSLDSGVNVRADTYAVIITPNLVSDRYVELTGAYAHGPKLADGTTIGLARTRTPVELDQLYRGLTSLFTALGPKGANKNGALNRLLRVGAANLAGNGGKIKSTIAALSRSGQTLAGSKEHIFATVRQLSQFTTTLAQHNSQLGSANRDLASVTQTLAADRNDFGKAIHDLSGALLLVKSFIQQNRAQLQTNVARLGTVAQSLGKRRESLARALESAPLLVQNFLNAYDPGSNQLRGRVDLNELTVWARENATTTDSTTTDSTTTDSTTTDSTTGRSVTATRSAKRPPGSAASTRSTSTAPPTLLPAVTSSGGTP